MWNGSAGIKGVDCAHIAREDAIFEECEVRAWFPDIGFSLGGLERITRPGPKAAPKNRRQIRQRCIGSRFRWREIYHSQWWMWFVAPHTTLNVKMSAENCAIHCAQRTNERLVCMYLFLLSHFFASFFFFGFLINCGAPHCDARVMGLINYSTIFSGRFCRLRQCVLCMS